MLNSLFSPNPPLKLVFVNHHILVKQIWLTTIIPTTSACKKERHGMCSSKESQYDSTEGKHEIWDNGLLGFD